MNITQLQRVIVDALEDVKAQDIRVYNTTHLTSLFDRVVIATGSSNRQTKALATSVRDAVKGDGGQVISIEGEETGEWVLVDCGDAIVHIMLPTIRQYYSLEEIWGEKPVRVKLASTETAAARKTALGLDEADAAPAKSSAKKKSATKESTTTTTSSPGRKTASAKTASTKAAGTKVAGAKVSSTKAANAKTPVRKTAARKTATQRHK